MVYSFLQRMERGRKGGNRVTSKDLEYFLSVYNSHSIKDSAKELFISSQGLSRKIIELEQEIGAPLFDRTAKGMIPTSAGRRLAYRAQTIINEFKEIRSDFSNATIKNGVDLTVPATYGVIQYLSVPFMKSFYEQHPHICLNLIEIPEKELFAALQKNEVEVAFAPAPIDYSRYNAIFCFSWKHCLVINRKNPLAKKERISCEDLAHVPLAVRGRSYSAFPSNMSRFLRRGVQPDILLETTSETLIHSIAEENMGIGITLEFQAQADRRPGTVIRYFEVPFEKEVYLISKKGISLSPAASAFSSFVMQWI